MSKAFYIDTTVDGGLEAIYEIQSTKKVDGVTLEARYSELDKEWDESVRGKIAATLTDTGNGVRITVENGNNVVYELGYNDIHVLKILMKEFDRVCSDTFGGKLYRTENIEEVK